MTFALSLATLKANGEIILAAWLIFEQYLAANKKIKANSTLQLAINLVDQIVKKNAAKWPMPVHKGPYCVGEELSRFKKGEMHSGKGGKVVTSSQQAKAIALSACGESKYAEMLQSMGYSEETAKEVATLFAESFVKSSKKSASSGAM